MSLISRHPNTVGAMIGAGALGQLVLFTLGQLHVQLSQGEAGLITGASAAVVLAGGRATKYLWRHGLVGAWQHIVHGSDPWDDGPA